MLKFLPKGVPADVSGVKVDWFNANGIVTLHLLLPIVIISGMVSWEAIIFMICAIFCFATLGINLCYHRLLTHRSFSVPKWLEYFLAVLGMCNLQHSPIRWVATHRHHHKYTDEQDDPHSPKVNFFWGHCGWLLWKNDYTASVDMIDRYARDLARDRFYLLMEKNQNWVWFYFFHLVLIFLVGEVFWGQGMLFLLWGGLIRTVVVWHITWSVNSFAHIYGYRSNDTPDTSRNNWLVGLFAVGEGWHNNHHAQPRSAKHGFAWWELDITYLLILILKYIGLAKDIRLPRRS